MTATKRRPAGPAFECTACGASAPRWIGRCAACGGWGTVEALPGNVAAPARPGAAGGPRPVALPVAEVPVDVVRARPTGIGELDRVLGGGVVPGAVVLLAGEPGVGKSTLLLEVAAALARRGGRVLYATGEESASAVRARADRVGAAVDGLWLTEAHELSTVLAGIEASTPDLVVIDSVQTLVVDDVDGAPGSVTQVKAVAEAAGALARRTGSAALLVGHVTKDGGVAGPRTLEHLVDVVCVLEGDRHASLRLLRAVKNRHGPTDEVGCFELDEAGMTEVADPSALFLSAPGASGPGSCPTVALEGRRPVAVEVQTLIAPAAGSPRRVTSGLDGARVAMVLAVVERRAGLALPGVDVYAATAGGLRVTEPGADLAVAVALASSVRDQPVPPGVVVMGELGLGGEVRRVPATQRRVTEAARLGMRTAIVPAGGERGGGDIGAPGIRVIEVRDVRQAVAAVWSDTSVSTPSRAVRLAAVGGDNPAALTQDSRGG